MTPLNSELYRANASQTNDSNAAYDPLGRLTNFARGTLSASTFNGGQFDTVASGSPSISYGLDALRNTTSKTTVSVRLPTSIPSLVELR